MSHIEIPAAAIPLVAALVPGLVAGAFLVFRRLAVARHNERAVRRDFQTRIMIRVHSRRGHSSVTARAASRPLVLEETRAGAEGDLPVAAAPIEGAA